MTRRTATSLFGACLLCACSRQEPPAPAPVSTLVSTAAAPSAAPAEPAAGPAPAPVGDHADELADARALLDAGDYAGARAVLTPLADDAPPERVRLLKRACAELRDAPCVARCESVLAKPLPPPEGPPSTPVKPMRPRNVPLGF